jgi:hypothetical protein
LDFLADCLALHDEVLIDRSYGIEREHEVDPPVETVGEESEESPDNALYLLLSGTAVFVDMQ